MAGPDVVVVVADSTQLERNLVLLAQVMQTGANPVLCLNMADEARAAGQTRRPAADGAAARLPGGGDRRPPRRGRGRPARGHPRARRDRPVSRHKLVLGEELDRALAAIRAAPAGRRRGRPGAAWTAVRLLLGDPEHVERVEALDGGEAAVAEARPAARAAARPRRGRDISVFVDRALLRLRRRAAARGAHASRRASDAAPAHRPHRRRHRPPLARAAHLRAGRCTPSSG